MGTYVNPSNGGFQTILRGEYVDKTGLISLVNNMLGTSRNLIVVTRPRRFGKSFAAQALAAYYSSGCDSQELFDGLDISHAKSYKRHLNAYNVVRLDMTEFTTKANRGNVVPLVKAVLLPELWDEAGNAAGGSDDLTAAILDVVHATGKGFVFIIDEWDAPLRECPAEADRQSWIEFLRLLFKNASFTGEAVAAAYMTGILPIKRYKGQSAVSDFGEYTILEPGPFAPYTGFTEPEVEALAKAHGMDMAELKTWYDGYDLEWDGETYDVYAPFSVMQACQRRKCGDYWPASASFDLIRTYIDLDLDGLQQAVLALVGGAEVDVDTGSFENDESEVASRDDALTLLAHLGYLSYRSLRGARGKVRVPNEEVREELTRAARHSRHPYVAQIVRQSEELLHATWDGDADTVARLVAEAHDGACAPLYYNDEQALRAVVRLAYLSAADHYVCVEELPSGRGYADMVWLPRRGDPAPSMVVELKWDKPVETALEQIRNRNYPAALRDLGGPVLLVGITYDAKSKEHRCVIVQTEA